VLAKKQILKNMLKYDKPGLIVYAKTLG
jgi:hypothetical protein